MLDLILTDTFIIDGTGRESYGPLDIGIKDERIAILGHLKNLPSKDTIEARGLYAAPGFIDIHAHSDLSSLITPPPESKIAQGVTTEVIGNCGLSAAPCLKACWGKIKDRCDEYGLELAWEYMSEYLALLEGKGLVNNLAALVGQGNIRGSVLGYDNQPATDEEISKMKELLVSSFEEGAFGLSAGLAYPPGCYTETHELIELAQTLSLSSGIVAFHLRSETETLIEAVSEVLKIAQEAKVKVHISHLKVSASNRKRLLAVFGMIEEASKGGTKISCDLYPYLVANTDLDIILPSWTWEGGRNKEVLRLKDRNMRRRIRLEIISSHPPEYWKNVTISKVTKEKNRWMEGKSLHEITQERDVVEFLLDLLIDEGLKVEANFFFGDEENLRRILKMPYAAIGSDASARSKEGVLSEGKPHPRAFGSFPRVLARYVREEKILSLEEAIYKMSGLTAKILGLTNRGRIAEEYFADLVLFDPLQIEDLATYDNPFQYPRGIEYTIVNGQVVWEKGGFTGVKPGKALRSTSFKKNSVKSPFLKNR
ncbi:TPA: amidohydrolase [bacterium]|nr:amidohydrolase [bacterium]